MISPVIKKSSLDRNILKNYRPVSNILFLSKVLEKVVATQLKMHIQVNKLDEVYQSAYKSNCSTETALLKVKSDVLNAVDRGEVVFIVLLDLSAAFDTVDHNLLLKCLHDNFGVTGTVLEWFASYLESRTSYVNINGVSSDQSRLIYGVPQGSVLGPLLYVMYTQPMGSIMRNHKVNFNSYADDTQLYVSLNPNIPGEAELALKKLQDCISDIMIWMNLNKLKLNNDKTEFFIAGTKQSLQKLPPLQLEVGNCHISPSSEIRNLGIVFDSEFKMIKQINSLVSSCNYHLRNLFRIGRYLDKETRHSVVRAVLLSRFDYGNALLYGATSKDLNRLQSLQNRCAKFIFSAARLDSPKPLLRALHWLPIRERIHFKLCLYVYKCMNNAAPAYLSNMLQRKTTPLSGPVTRSAMDGTLLLTSSSKKRVGEGAFSIAGPVLWNSLPSHIRNSKSVALFKKQLKTYLFN